MRSSVSTVVTSGIQSETVAATAISKTEKETAISNPVEGHNDADHFFWTYTEEPHRTRRQAIIKAHPEVLFDVLKSQLLADDPADNEAVWS